MRRLSFLILFMIVLTACGQSQTKKPGALPEGWQIYNSGNISIGIAPEWEEYNHPAGIEDTGAWLSLPNNATLAVSSGPVGICGLGSGAEAADIQKCLAESSQGWIYPDEIDIVAMGEWWDGVHKGDYVELINKTHVDYRIRIIALIPPEENQTLEIFYDREGLTSPTDIEREQLRKAIATIQLIPQE